MRPICISCLPKPFRILGLQNSIIQRRDSALHRFPADLPSEDSSQSKPIALSVGKTATRSDQAGCSGTVHRGPSPSPSSATRRTFKDAFKPIEVTDSESEGELPKPSQHAGVKVVKSSSAVKRKQTLRSKEETLVDVISQAFERDMSQPPQLPPQQVDDIAVFTEHIARQLRAVKDPQKCAIMQNSIENALFKCRMEFWGNPSVGATVNIAANLSPGLNMVDVKTPTKQVTRVAQSSAVKVSPSVSRPFCLPKSPATVVACTKENSEDLYELAHTSSKHIAPDTPHTITVSEEYSPVHGSQQGTSDIMKVQSSKPRTSQDSASLKKKNTKDPQPRRVTRRTRMQKSADTSDDSSTPGLDAAVVGESHDV